MQRRPKPEAVWTGGFLGRGHERASGKPKLKAAVRIWGRAIKVKFRSAGKVTRDCHGPGSLPGTMVQMVSGQAWLAFAVP